MGGAATTETVSQMLGRWQEGDEEASERLMPLVYGELRRLAQRQMRSERGDHTLQPTALVHEAYARLAGQELTLRNRANFLGMMARLMRQVLVDHARARRAAKRGSAPVRLALSEVHGLGDEPDRDVIDLNRALERLASEEERAAHAVELHYFGGLSHVEIAEALGVSAATVDRDLRYARAWLRRELDDALQSDES